MYSFKQFTGAVAVVFIPLQRLLHKKGVRIVLSIGAVAAAFLCLARVSYNPPCSTVLYDRNGELLGASVASDGQWRFPPDSTVPYKFATALVLCEDRRFYYHPGFDPFALIRAFFVDIRAKRFEQGGSTLTMQLMRLSLPGNRRTITQKLLEITLAVRESVVHSKKATLARYASLAPMGGNVVGLRAAAWRYFGCEASNLTWAQSATLAVLPNSPGLIHPGRNREALARRRDRLLHEICSEGLIDSATLKLSLAEPLPEKPHALPRLAPHLLQRLAQEHASDKNAHAYICTLDKRLQQRATAIVKGHHRNLAGNSIFNAAAVVADVNSGEVLAYVGNVEQSNSRRGGSVDVITAPRSTGSILKPFLYAAMLEDGELLPDQLVADIPTHMGGFAPQNYNRTFEGAVPASMALSRSLNVPVVRMLRTFGVERFTDKLKKLGMTTLTRSPDDYGMSLILGGAEGTLWDITGMYAGMARTLNRFAEKGERNAFFPLKAEVNAVMKPQSTIQLGPAACYLTIKALLEVVRPEEESAWFEFASGKRIAWKTGTSYGHRDAWAVGITPGYVIGVWVGNADGNGRSGLTGISCAAPILFDLFNTVPASGWFTKPEYYLRKIAVCHHSGLRAGQFCSSTDTIMAPAAGLETEACRYCRLVHLDSTMKWRVNSECTSVSTMKAVSWFVLPPSMEWYYKQKHATYRTLPPFREDCRLTGPKSDNPSLSLIYPSHNTNVYIPLELDGKRGRIILQAAHRDPSITLFWHLDSDYLGSTLGIHKMECVAGAGRHLVTVVDENGEERRHLFTVLSD